MLEYKKKGEKREIKTDEINTYKQDDSERRFEWKNMIYSIIYGSIMLTQFILVFFFYNYYHFDFLAWIGWGFFVLFMIVGALPRNEFKKHGGVLEGKSHIHTTKLVNTGIYSIVRHPYWLCWIFLSLTVTFMSQHWIMVLLAIPACTLVYVETFSLDKGLVEKFGNEYMEYKKKVPRINLFLGIILYIIRNNKKLKN